MPCLVLLLVLGPFPKDPHLLTAADVGHPHGQDPQDQASKEPDFSLTDFNGQPLALSQFKGKVVLLDFWASWCTPCQAEIPRFIEWQKQYGEQGLQVIGISMDDDEKAARKFAERMKPNYPIAMGNAKVAEAFGGVLGLPANLIISRSGKVMARHEGGSDLDTMEQEIRLQLAVK
ncbi:MAG: TlpA family protein disulfide reductase [Acidobacteriaceae bacterium]